MAIGDFRNKFAIVGLGVTKMGHQPGISARAFEVEAARLAIEDAGLKRKDIEACIHSKADGSPGSTYDWSDYLPRVMGLPVKVYFSVCRGGAGATLSIVAATKLLEMGIAKYVLITYGLNEWSASRIDPMGGHQVGAYYEKKGVWGPAFGCLDAVHIHSAYMSRHMYEYGTTPDQLGAIAVSIRQWACLNPSAYMYGRPITIDDYEKSPIIAWPYRLLDCCLVSDGGTAFIITTADRAKDLKKPPIFIMGIGFGEQEAKLWWEKANYTKLAVETAKAHAFKEAAIELKDIDAAQFYDCFSGEVLLSLEDYGWCKKGEGGAFVEAGSIAPSGTIPVNTGGGMLSSHYQIDFTGLAEAVIQLRGEGETRQIKDAEICLVTGHGGEMITPGMCAIHSTLVLRR